MDQSKRRFRVGDRVVKDPAGWEPSDFDGWGAGEGVGVIVEPEITVEQDDDGDFTDLVDVRWPAGRCFQKVKELLPAPQSDAG